MEDYFKKEYDNPKMRLKEYIAFCNINLQKADTTISEDFSLPNPVPIHNHDPNSRDYGEELFEAIEDSLRRNIFD